MQRAAISYDITVEFIRVGVLEGYLDFPALPHVDMVIAALGLA